MKKLLTAFVVADAMLLLLSVLWMFAGYPLGGVGALLAAGALVFVAARFWANTPDPAEAAPTEWLVWDEELEDELSDVERRMLRDGCVRLPDPVDAHQAQMARALNSKPLGGK